MCVAIALARSEVPTELIGRYGLERRAHIRGTLEEFRFAYRDRSPRLPIVRDGQLQIARWGNGRGQSRSLPATGWTWRATVEAGDWRHLGAEPIEIPATLAEDRGVWYHVRQGIRGLLVPDERGMAVAYMICEPSTHYYRIMTRSERMPMLIGERI